MPDQDIYNRHVPKGWQTAARIAFTSRDDQFTTQMLLRALGEEVNQGGCPGIHEIAAIVADVVASPNASPYEEISGRLDRIVRRHAKERTYLAREAARKIVLDFAISPFSTPLVLNDGRVDLAVSKALLVELAISKVSPPALAAELKITREVSTYEFVQRQERMGDLLSKSPEIENLAQRLLDAPQGHGLRAPRVTITKMSAEELASYQLTE